MESDKLASDRTNFINNELYQRNVPSQPLEPYYSSSPQTTKFTRFPIISRPINATIPIKDYGVYNNKSTFYPAHSNAPWSGRISNIDKESNLKNQNYALQYDSLGTYIPSTNSDLYNINWSNKQNYSQELNSFFTNSSLFTPQKHGSFNPNPNSDEVGYNLFNNSTRSQIKNLKA